MNLRTYLKNYTLYLKRPWCWERLKAGGEGDDRGWDGWMASLSQWIWVWVNSGSWWWTGRPGALQSMGSQSRTRLSDWTELRFKKQCKQHESVYSLSHIWLFATLWTVAHQAPLSMGFSRQGYWSGLPLPSTGDLPDTGIKPGSPASQADALPSEPLGKDKEYEMVHIECAAGSVKPLNAKTWAARWGQQMVNKDRHFLEER